MKNIDKHLEKRDFFNLYLIYGNEEYLKKEYENKFIKSILTEEDRFMNFNYFEGKSITAENIIETSETLPFFAKHRLIIIKDSGFLYEGKKQESEKLTEYINKLPKTSIIIFFEKNVDKRLKIFKEFKKIAYITEINYLKETDLCVWISNIFNMHSKKIDTSTIIYLIRFVGSDMKLLYNEVNKILDYKNLEDFISKEDIEKICTKSLETTVFELISSIGSKDLAKAIDLYNNLLFNKISPFMVLSMIYRQFKLILQVKYLNNQGFSTSEISKKLSILDFIVKDCIKQGKNFTNKILLKGLEDCLITDFNIKTGKIQDILAVEVLIIKYSS